MNNGRKEPSYNAQAAVDSKNKLIVAFDVSNCASDYNNITPLCEQTSEVFKTSDYAVVADKGYDSATDMAMSSEKGHEVHVAGTDMHVCIETEKDEESSITEHMNGRCVYIKKRNVALCPMGKILFPKVYYDKEGRGVFENKEACHACTSKCSKKAVKSFKVSIDKDSWSTNYDDSNLYIKQIRIKADKKIVKKRKAIVEHPFGTIKRAMDSSYLLMRTLKNVEGEISLSFLAYNIKRAINILGTQKLIENIRAYG